tara:strand:- start:91 stop:378 length:288 start_codon:yes stop_codon:yes gene_type:complete
MKISKQRLKQIIKEEIEDAKQETTPEEDVQALGDFSEKLLQISKDIRNTKGLDVKEMTQILNIFSTLIKLSSQKTAGSLLTQVTDLINKKIGIEQ